MTTKANETLRLGTALFWIVGGPLHFVMPRRHESFVPPRLGRRRLWARLPFQILFALLTWRGTR